MFGPAGCRETVNPEVDDRDGSRGFEAFDPGGGAGPTHYMEGVNIDLGDCYLLLPLRLCVWIILFWWRLLRYQSFCQVDASSEFWPSFCVHTCMNQVLMDVFGCVGQKFEQLHSCVIRHSARCYEIPLE